MSVDALLSRLENVRPAGKGRWRAKCPAHGGKNRYALAISESPEGVVLLHCFVCEGGAGEIASAIGLDMSELFPPRTDHGKRIQKPYRRSEVLEALENDLRVVYIMCGDLAFGTQEPTVKDRLRAAEAQKRIGRLLSELSMSV